MLHAVKALPQYVVYTHLHLKVFSYRHTHSHTHTRNHTYFHIHKCFFAGVSKSIHKFCMSWQCIVYIVCVSVPFFCLGRRFCCIIDVRIKQNYVVCAFIHCNPPTTNCPASQSFSPNILHLVFGTRSTLCGLNAGIQHSLFLKPSLFPL